MISRRQGIARLQSDFYRDQFRKILNGLAVALVIIFLLISGIAYLTIVRPSQQYYANTTGGLLFPMPDAVKS